MKNDFTLLTGTISGTLVSLLSIVGWNEIGRTLILLGIGTTVSFLVTLGLKKIFKLSDREGPT